MHQAARALADPVRSPSSHAQVANLLGEEIPQIYALCGRGPRSTLRVLRPGLAVTELAVSPLPGNPTAVWTIRRSLTDEFDAYIVVSFTNATLVRTDIMPRRDCTRAVHAQSSSPLPPRGNAPRARVASVLCAHACTQTPHHHD